MDSQLTGSNELLYVQTEKVSVTIKGKAAHPNFQGIEYKMVIHQLRFIVLMIFK